MLIRLCLYCKKPFKSPKKGNVWYCSSKCKYEANYDKCKCGKDKKKNKKVCVFCYNKNRLLAFKDLKKMCPICNKSFITKFKKAKYCSEKCNQIAIMKRRILKMNNKYDSQCCICGNKNNLHFHHIIPQEKRGKETISLCKHHHLLIHKFMWILENKKYKIIKI